MDSTKDKNAQIAKQLLVSNTRQFDLSTAYRLLIGAYIRSTGKTKDDGNHEETSGKQTESRENHHHEVDFNY